MQRGSHIYLSGLREQYVAHGRKLHPIPRLEMTTEVRLVGLLNPYDSQEGLPS